MICIVRNQDGIEELIDSSVIRLESTDVILVNTNSDEAMQNIAEAFPFNRIIKDYGHNITIIKNPNIVNVNPSMMEEAVPDSQDSQDSTEE